MNTECKFLGVDPDEEESGKLYKTILKGVFVKGSVGAKAGIYKTDVLVRGSTNLYKHETLLHYSFQDFLARYYKHDIIDYLFIDIEGDEYALMKDLIQNPEKYPTICQINVEYHSPFENDRGLEFFADFKKSLKSGPFFPLNVDAFKSAFFNR
uniref:Methyltransferase FkbM domain-containing protein n=1 Tax=Panagrolaimus sp. ES5 TaxID=591445 RepID=A0AC34G5M4_9BILA